LTGTNTLAYFAEASTTRKTSFYRRKSRFPVFSGIKRKQNNRPVTSGFSIPGTHLRDGPGNARTLPGAAGNGSVRAGSAEGRLGLEGGHALGNSGGQGELLAELDVGAALGCLAEREMS